MAKVIVKYYRSHNSKTGRVRIFNFVFPVEAKEFTWIPVWAADKLKQVVRKDVETPI